MGKFLHFNNKPQNDHLGPTGKKIVKRTSHFIQKKAAKWTQHVPSNYASLAMPPSDHERCRKAYEAFVVSHDLAQAWPKSWKESTRPEDADLLCLNAAQLQFQELLYEVIYTEHSYVDDLTLAYQIFAKDALTWPDLPKSLRLIFDNLVQIIRLHLGLLQDLRSRQRAQHPIVRTIADIFLNYAPRFLDYYSAYFINFEKANQVVVSAMASKTDPLGTYFKTRSTWPECRNLTLQSFLLKPVQRLMKYPLFFKSLSDSLAHLDPDRLVHLRTLHELKLVIQRIEVDKKESEEERKLEDLACRIHGMTNLVVPHRRLVYEGYLTLLPSMQAPLMRSVTKDALGGQHYTYAPHPNVTRSHSSTSLSSSHQNNKKRLYVFLFNDMILITKVRSKTRLVDDHPPSCYGPTPTSLFKLTHGPGQLTFVDRSVARAIPTANEKGSWSLRRSWSTHQSIYPLQSSYEEHPHQFICSIATQHITNYHFETSTSDEKKQWCTRMEQVLESHVQRPDWWQPPSLYKSFASSVIDHHSRLLHEKTQLDMDVDDSSDDFRTAVSSPVAGLEAGQGV